MGSAVDLVAGGAIPSTSAASGLAGVESPAGFDPVDPGLTPLIGLTQLDLPWVAGKWTMALATLVKFLIKLN